MKMLMANVILVCSLLVGAGGGVLQAQTGNNVWGVIASTYEGYVSLFSPPQVSDLYILADRQHVINPRQTRVYYWPIDREYKPDWSALNETLEGNLEVLNEQGQLIQTLEKSWYVMVPAVEEGDSSALLIGEESRERYDQYLQKRQEYLEDMEAYDQALEEYLDRQSEGQEDLGEPPVRPEPGIELEMPRPRRAFILDLPAGIYQIQLRDSSGEVVPETERQLHVIEPRRESVGYQVIPEEKWTRPEFSDEPGDTIYFPSSGTQLYIQAQRTLEFNELEYTRLTEPQNDTASAERWLWVPVENILDRPLRITSSAGMSEQILSEVFSVKQLPGGALGYQVVQYDPEGNLKPDFEGYPLRLEGEVERYTLNLVDKQGDPVPGSERMMVRAESTLPVTAWLVVLVPFLVGLYVRLRRDRKLRRTKQKMETSIE
jgi:hypothetical protein